MTVIQDIALDAGGNPVPFATVHVALVTGGPSTPGYTGSGDIIATYQTDATQTGQWSATLTPNASITPANTYYLVSVGPTATSAIIVPASGGPYTLLEVLATEPPTPSAPGITGVQVAAGGTVEGVRPEINLIAGSGMTVTAADNSGANRVDVTLSAAASGGALLAVNNLDDVQSVSVSRTNLGLGSAALLASSAVAQTANNLSDLVSASSARTNLGLGTAATQSASAFDAAGAAGAAQTAAESFATTAVATETTRAETAEALLAPLASPALTGSPTAPTKAPLTDSTDIATTAYTDAAVAVETTRAETAEAAFAPLASPALTGSPTAPTQTTGDNSTKLATDAFVATAVAAETTRAEAAEATKLTAASNLSDVANAATARGNLAAAKSGANGDITSLTGLTTPLPVSEGGTGSGTQNFVDLTTGQSIAGVKNFTTEITGPTPVNAGDLVTKSYADAIAQGLSVKSSVQEATAAALPANTYANGTAGVGATLTATANGALTVDGISVTAGDRVLVQNESTAANNGVYAVTATGSGSTPYILTRTADMDTPAQVPGAFTFVEQGSVNAAAGFVVASEGPFAIGTTAIVWTQFSGAGEITAGTGLAKTGNVVALSTPVSIANGGTGQTAQQAAINALTGSQSAGKVLRSDGTNATLSAIQVGDVPTLNQSTTGNAATATSSTSFTGALAGDVTGTQSATVVGAIQGVAVTTGDAELVSNLNNATVRSTGVNLQPGEETVVTGSSSGQTYTLPASPPASSINTVTNASTQAITLAPGAGASLNSFGTTGSISIPSGYSFSVVYINTTWRVQTAGPSDFAKSNALSIANGGTGQTTAAAAYNALSPMTSTGDIEYESGASTAARLPGNISATKNFLTQTGTGSASAAPAWGTIAAADLPSSSNVQTFTTVGTATWTKPANATTVTAICIGGGGGGGSGAVEASGTIASGGAGGGGGGYTIKVIPAAFLSSSETVTVGGGGAGGTAVGATASNGNAGSGGGPSWFKSSSWAVANGGGAGGGGTTAAASGGSGGTGSIQGAGGGGSSGTGTAGPAGSSSAQGGPGGGAGGGVNVGGTAFAGGAGALVYSSSGTSGGNAGTSGGGAGGAGASVTTGAPLAGTAGGGGGSSVTAVPGGTGGAGGLYGAGGGGGGASLTGQDSGAGGAGGNGVVIVISTL